MNDTSGKILRPKWRSLRLFVGWSLGLVSCGAPQQKSTVVFHHADLKTATNPEPSANQSEADFNLFQNMLNFGLEISGCTSGYSAIFNKSNLSQIKLYKNDKGCLAKLLRFTAFDGTEYAPKPSAGFTNYLAGDSAIFENITNTKSVKVSIITQLSSPIAPTDTIDYRYSSLSQDSQTKKILTPTWDQVGIDVKNPATTPKVQIKQAELVELVTSSRKGVFNIYVECETTMVADKCQGVGKGDLRFDLNVDTNNSCSATNPNACDTATVKERTLIVVQPGDALMPRGGFIFNKIDTPVALASAKNLIFVLKRIADNSNKPPIKESIRVWNFDIEVGATFELTEVAALGIMLLGKN